MSNKQFQCPRCFKRCGNTGALKTHMKKNNKPEPKSGSMMKWIVKREPVKSERKKKVDDMVELQPIVKTRQLKLRKPPVREPSIVSNPARPRPSRAPRRSKQPVIDTSPFVAPARLSDPDLDKSSPQFRIAHVQHFNSLKSDFPIFDKTMYHKVNKSCLGVGLRRFQAWFKQYEADLKTVRTPKTKKERHQNQVHHPKENSAARNFKQTSAEKAAAGLKGCARTASWPASEANQTKSIEALIHPFSKIIRERSYCIPL